MSGPRLARRLRHLPIGAALALLVAGVLGTGSARAACAHDHPGLADAPDHFRSLRISGAMRSASESDHAAAPSGPRDRRETCSGPSCSRREGLPPSVPSLGVVRAGQWAVIAEPSPPAEPPAAWSTPGEAEARPRPMASAIFHPPRRDAVVA